MAEIHKPSRKQAIIFFIFTLAVAAVIILWTFILDKGTLVVEGPVPFNIKIGSQISMCEISPCKLKLSARQYNIILNKGFFFDDIRDTKIKRWKTVTIKADFQFIPQVHEIGDIILPDNNAFLRPPFLGLKKFENFPKNAKDTKFSADDKSILLTLGKEIYLYEIAAKTVEKTNLKPDFYPTWAGNKIVFLETENDQQILKLIDGKNEQTVAAFDRPFKNPRLLGSPDGNYILIEENADNSTYYLVDAVKKSRKRLSLPETARNAKWTSTHIVFENGAGKFFALDPNNLQTTYIPAAYTIENINEMDSEIFIFTSLSKETGSETHNGQSITEALEDAKKEIGDSFKPTGLLFINKFDKETGQIKTLAEFALKKDEKLLQLTPDKSGKTIYFTINEKLFEVLLEDIKD